MKAMRQLLPERVVVVAILHFHEKLKINPELSSVK